VALKISKPHAARENANGTRDMTFSAQWDSSLHESLLLDRVTAERYRVQLVISWEISSKKLSEPMKFSQKVCVQIMPRSFVRQSSLWSAWNNARFVKTSTGIFTLTVRPAPIKRVGDLWRANSQHDYVKGEENLAGWAPRGVSLVSDFIHARKKRQRIAEIGAMQTILGKMGLDPATGQKSEEPETEPSPELKPYIPNDDDLLKDTPESSAAPSLNGDAEDKETEELEEETIKVDEDPEKPKSEYDENQTELLERSLKLWTKYPDPLSNILSTANTTPPENGATEEATLPPSLISTIIRVPKNPTVLKGGYLLVPNENQTEWLKRFAELRRPYLHLHTITDGEEVGLVSLRNSRIDSQPGILGMLHGTDDYGTAGPNGNGGSTFTPGHRRTASGRVISTVWTGGGDGQVGPSKGRKERGITRLPERMQAATFAIYGTDNTWLFTARSEKDKNEWIFRIDQTYNMSNGGSATNSGMMSPQQQGSQY